MSLKSIATEGFLQGADNVSLVATEGFLFGGIIDPGEIIRDIVRFNVTITKVLRIKLGC